MSSSRKNSRVLFCLWLMCSCIVLNSDTPPGSLGIGTWISEFGWERLGYWSTNSGMIKPALWTHPAFVFDSPAELGFVYVCSVAEVSCVSAGWCMWTGGSWVTWFLQSDIRVWAGVGGPSLKQAAGRWRFIGALRTPEWGCSALGSARPRPPWKVFFSPLQWIQHAIPI